MNKFEIRKTFLSKRKSLEIDEVKNKSKIINSNILKVLSNFPDIKSIGLFYPFDNEVEVLDLCLDLEANQIHVTLPVVKSKLEPLDYKIFSYQAHNVAKGYRGILEPIHSLSLEPEAIVVSCSAFNLEKYRVGYGGGFYDRTIEKFKEKNKNFFTILAAFDMQQCDEIFQEQYDQKVDFICTETSKI